MSLSEEERQVIVNLELSKAHDTFAQVAVLRQAEFWDGVANRLYYSAFHAVCALLIKYGHNVRTHNGASAVLGQCYVRTGILSKEAAQLYSMLQTMREKSDYNCSFNATQSIIEPLISPTGDFISSIERIIDCNNCN